MFPLRSALRLSSAYRASSALPSLLSIQPSTALASAIGLPSVRYYGNPPINTIFVFVPQQEAWIVERMGKFKRILQPGLNVLIPIVDRIAYVQCMKEKAIEIPKQSAVTKDNVTLSIDGVLYLRLIDAYKTSYGVEEPEFAITQLAQTTMRSELGKIDLDAVFKERDALNVAIVAAINKAATAWGIQALRYEIRDIKLPERVQLALQMQVEAERKKRAQVLESEGIRDSEINVAEGKKQAEILSSEANRIRAINQAQGTASAIETVAAAKASALNRINLALSQSSNAASLSIAEQYIAAFEKLAKETNTIIIPSDTANVSSLVAQCLTMYKSIEKGALKPSGSIDENITKQLEYDSDPEPEIETIPPSTSSQPPPPAIEANSKSPNPDTINN